MRVTWLVVLAAAQLAHLVAGVLLDVTQQLPITAHVINLQRRGDRWAAIQAAFAPHAGCIRLQRFDAIEHPLITQGPYAGNISNGATASHIAVVHAVLQQQPSPPPAVLVLEDDAVPQPHFCAALTSLLSHALPRLHTWDLVNLASHRLFAWPHWPDVSMDRHVRRSEGWATRQAGSSSSSSSSSGSSSDSHNSTRPSTNCRGCRIPAESPVSSISGLAWMGLVAVLYSPSALHPLAALNRTFRDYPLAHPLSAIDIVLTNNASVRARSLTALPPPIHAAASSEADSDLRAVAGYTATSLAARYADVQANVAWVDEWIDKYGESVRIRGELPLHLRSPSTAAAAPEAPPQAAPEVPLAPPPAYARFGVVRTNISYRAVPPEQGGGA